MAGDASKKDPQVAVVSRNSSTGSSAPSLKSPRTARFAEATSVDSPGDARPNPFPFTSVERTSYYQPQAQVADVGFGYIGGAGAHQSAGPGVEMPLTPRSPLKSALKTPGAPPRNFENLMSPTFNEEDALEKAEKHTEKEQKKDLSAKIRVRMAKCFLRFTNFACSLIVLSMLSATFTIFNATKALPPRNNLPPWAVGTRSWPQITLLVIACISLFFSLVIFYGYWRGGHKRAERVAIYYTVFAVAFFMFSIVMWCIGAGVLQGSRANGNGQDIWGWSCKDNARKQLFQSDVSYDLVCRLQNWSLVCCIIEVVVELITISIYGIAFYRYYSKRKLRKSMANRDAARSELYLAQLRSQSAPGTPAPYSPRDGGYNPMFSPRFANFADKQPTVEVTSPDDNDGVRYIDASQRSPQKPFVLGTPPQKNGTPKSQQGPLFSPTQARALYPAEPHTPGIQAQPVHQPPAPGEEHYESVPIPGAYASPLHSPTHPGAPQGFFGAL